MIRNYGQYFQSLSIGDTYFQIRHSMFNTFNVWHSFKHFYDFRIEVSNVGKVLALLWRERRQRIWSQMPERSAVRVAASLPKNSEPLWFESITVLRWLTLSRATTRAWSEPELCTKIALTLWSPIDSHYSYVLCYIGLMVITYRYRERNARH